MRKLLAILATATLMLPSFTYASDPVCKAQYEDLASGNAQAFGRQGPGAAEYTAMQFTVAATCVVTQIASRARINLGSPTSVPFLAIYSDNGSNLPNASIESVNTSIVTASPNFGTSTVTFAGTTNLAVGTKYWLVWGTDTFNSSNYYAAEQNNVNTFLVKDWNGSDWTTDGPGSPTSPFVFEIRGTSGATAASPTYHFVAYWW